MKKRLFISIVLLLGLFLPQVTQAQIAIAENYKLGEMIKAGCNCIVPEGYQIRTQWAFTSGESLSQGNDLLIWAAPGKHDIAMNIVMLKTKKVTIGGEELEVLLDLEFANYSSSFTVGTPPAPKPDPDDPKPPGPTPTDFKSKVRAEADKINDPQTRIQIANNYGSISSRAVATQGWTVASLHAAVTNEHGITLTTAQLTKWQPFFPALAAIIKQNPPGPALQDHTALFDEIADALK